jgi:hypothetical protein
MRAQGQPYAPASSCSSRSTDAPAAMPARRWGVLLPGDQQITWTYVSSRSCAHALAPGADRSRGVRGGARVRPTISNSHRRAAKVGWRTRHRAGQRRSHDRASGRLFGGSLGVPRHATGYLAKITEAEITQSCDAAAAVGDDRIQQTSRAMSRQNPGPMAHPSNASGLKDGMQSGDPDTCDTPGWTQLTCHGLVSPVAALKHRKPASGIA